MLPIMQVMWIIGSFLIHCPCLYAILMVTPGYNEVVQTRHQRVELPCRYTTASKTNATINWTKGRSSGSPVLQAKQDGKEIPGNGYAGRVKLGENASLVIEELSLSDTSNYTCKILNFKDTIVEGTSVVNLLVAVKPTIVESSAQDVFFHTGQDISLVCIGQGIPKPDISWSRDDHELAETHNRLQIIRADLFQSGYYRCVLNNSVGNVSSVFRVTFCGSFNIEKGAGTLILMCDALFFIGMVSYLVYKKCDIHKGVKWMTIVMTVIALAGFLFGCLLLSLFLSFECLPDVPNRFIAGVVFSSIGIIAALIWTFLMIRSDASSSKEDPPEGEGEDIYIKERVMIRRQIQST